MFDSIDRSVQQRKWIHEVFCRQLLYCCFQSEPFTGTVMTEKTLKNKSVDIIYFLIVNKSYEKQQQ